MVGGYLFQRCKVGSWTDMFNWVTLASRQAATTRAKFSWYDFASLRTTTDRPLYCSVALLNCSFNCSKETVSLSSWTVPSLNTLITRCLGALDNAFALVTLGTLIAMSFSGSFNSVKRLPTIKKMINRKMISINGVKLIDDRSSFRVLSGIAVTDVLSLIGLSLFAVLTERYFR